MAAAARKREKKKRRKAEKRGKIEDEEEDMDEEEKEEVKENGDATTEDEKEKSPEINAEGDSGIDANSQGSGASNDKEEKSGKKKKNKKKNKAKNDKNNADNNSDEKENTNLVANRGDSKEKSPGEEDDRPDSRSDRNSQPRVPCTIEGHSVPEVEKTKTDSGFIEPQRKRKDRSLRQSESISETKVEPAKTPAVTNNKKAGTTAGGKPVVPDAGWKEVVRKSKKVSVPSNAISRVIGRGGSNINAIRELSGAHIEVEKQSKGQGDRTILIKGSAEATRLANTWISAIIASPDKDLADIVGRQQYKTLSSVNLAKGGSSSTVVVTKTVVKTVLTTTGAQGVQKSKSAQSVQKASAAVTAVTATSTKMTVTYSSAITSKTKPVTSTSFAAIAAGQDNFGMMNPTGPPPASALKPAAVKAPGAPAKEKDGQRKTESSTAPPLMPPSSQGVDSKDYSPFKTFKMPGGGFVNWGAEKSESEAAVGQGFKGFANPSVSAVSQATIGPAAPEDLAKAPGCRQQQQPQPQQLLNSGSPNSMAASSVAQGWQAGTGSSSQQASTSLAPGYKKQVVTTVVTMMSTTTAEVSSSQQRAAGGIFPTQERCNSAPGTPVSPLVTPSPIAPPPAQAATSKPNATTSSPGSEPDWFARPGTGALGYGLRSMTPDGDLDRGWGGLREDLGAGCQQARQGTGSYGHNSPAKAPGAPIPELFGRKLEGGGMQEQNLLTAAAQLSNLGSGGYGDLLTSTAASIPLPDPSASALPLSSSLSAFGRFGAGSNAGAPGAGLGPRFTSPGAPNTTGLVFSQPPTMSVPSAGLPKGLNPNAPDFNRGGMYNQIRGGPRQGLPPQQQ